jgi:DNA-directed RNA polymerase sigma subunit (sigma70/sigma32)
MNWHETVVDPDEIKVFMALDGPEYTWRTMSAIARQTGLSEERVAQILAKYNFQFTRLSQTPSVSGSALVGLIEKVGV